MKMREELELYKGKCADLEVKLEVLKDDQAETLTNLERTCDGKLSVLVAEHKKVLEQKENTIKYRDDSVKDLTTQVNNLHDILDVIPGVLPREKEGQYGNSVNPCHVRLASVLAQKFM